MDIHPPGIDRETVDKLLTTTRAVRKRLDLHRPVPLDVVLECLQLALQAPSGNNVQAWRWLIVTDPEQRARLAELYRNRPANAAGPNPAPVLSDDEATRRVLASSTYLRDHLHEVPALVVPCIQETGGAAGWQPSIYPAVWSLMLALRSRGLGTVLTTAHLFRKDEAAALLGVPNGYAQACLLPIAYYTGDDFGPANRRPLSEVCYLDHWGKPVPGA